MPVGFLSRGDYYVIYYINENKEIKIIDKYDNVWSNKNCVYSWQMNRNLKRDGYYNAKGELRDIGLVNCEICTQNELKKINPAKYLSNGMFVCEVHYENHSSCVFHNDRKIEIYDSSFDTDDFDAIKVECCDMEFPSSNWSVNIYFNQDSYCRYPSLQTFEVFPSGKIGLCLFNDHMIKKMYMYLVIDEKGKLIEQYLVTDNIENALKNKTEVLCESSIIKYLPLFRVKNIPGSLKCVAILKEGTRKGQPCDSPTRYGKYCPRHEHFVSRQYGLI
jgi:hypothetical protein